MILNAELNLPLAVSAVALDLDGTLLDTAPDLAEAANRMLAELELPKIEVAVVMTYVGNGAEKLVKRLLTGDMNGEPGADILNHAKAVFFRHYEAVLDMHTKAYHGVLDGLAFLKSSGFRLACVTNKPARFTMPLLESMGMREYFELVLSGDSLPAKKPDPMPLLHLCEKFGINPNQLVMVGDSSADIEAAKGAGCYAFYVPYGYNRGLSAEAMGADVVLDALIDIKNLIVKNHELSKNY